MSPKWPYGGHGHLVGREDPGGHPPHRRRVHGVNTPQYLVQVYLTAVVEF